MVRNILVAFKEFMVCGTTFLAKFEHILNSIEGYEDALATIDLLPILHCGVTFVVKIEYLK